jgi:hypothetical protein
MVRNNRHDFRIQNWRIGTAEFDQLLKATATTFFVS